MFSQVNLQYNLRKDVKFRFHEIRTVLYGTKILSYLWPNFWNLIPAEIKDSATVETFCKKAKEWNPDRYLCRLCKTFIGNLGFVTIYWRYLHSTCWLMYSPHHMMVIWILRSFQSFIAVVASVGWKLFSWFTLYIHIYTHIFVINTHYIYVYGCVCLCVCFSVFVDK